MSNSIKDRFLKEHELSLEDLEQVRGGITQNADGTYNIYDGQLIRRSDMWYAYVYGNYPNATESTRIEYYYYVVDLKGDMIESGWVFDSLSYLMKYIT